MGIGRALWVACASALVAGSAQAATQWRLTPALTLAGGADDNVLFNNANVGDQVARGTARLTIRAYERLWHVTGDLALGGLGYNAQDKFVWLGETTWHAGARLNRETRVDGLARVRAADDPLALAQVGLLAGQGRTLGYRTALSFEHRLDRAWRAGTAFRYDGVRFLDNSTQKDGDAVGIAAFAGYRYSRALTFQGPVEERIFLQDGVLGTSSAVVPGVRWRAMRRTFLEAAVGPLAFLDDQGAVWLPVARLKFEHQWRWAAVDVTASNDLTVPAGRGGVLYGQILEGVGRYGSHDWEFRGRAGYYRSHPSPRDDRWVPGYGLEAGAFRRLGGAVWLGVTALRFERLETAFEPALARDAIYLRLDFTGERP